VVSKIAPTKSPIINWGRGREGVANAAADLY